MKRNKKKESFKKIFTDFFIEPLIEQEWELVKVLAGDNGYDSRIPSKIIKEGWFTARAICKSGFNQSTTNVPHYTNKLIKKNLIETDKIPYFYKRKRKKTPKVRMYRLKRTPFFKYQIFRLFLRKCPEDIGEKLLDFSYFDLYRIDTTVRNQPNWQIQGLWYIRGIDKEIERFQSRIKYLTVVKKGIMLAKEGENQIKEFEKMYPRLKSYTEKLKEKLKSKTFRDSTEGKECIDWVKEMKKICEDIKTKQLKKQMEAISKR